VGNNTAIMAIITLSLLPHHCIKTYKDTPSRSPGYSSKTGGTYVKEWQKEDAP